LCSRTSSIYINHGRTGNKYPTITIKAKPFDLGKKEAPSLSENGLDSNSIDVGNNAGSLSRWSSFESVAHWNPVNTNLYSVIAYRTLLPKWMEQKSGHIFNMFLYFFEAYTNGGSYSSSKTAL